MTTPSETASAAADQASEALASLARRTGKSLEEIKRLAAHDELRSLFKDGELLTEFRGGQARGTDAAIAGASGTRQREPSAHQFVDPGNVAIQRGRW